VPPNVKIRSIKKIQGNKKGKTIIENPVKMIVAEFGVKVI